MKNEIIRLLLSAGPKLRTAALKATRKGKKLHGAQSARLHGAQRRKGYTAYRRPQPRAAQPRAAVSKGEKEFLNKQYQLRLAQEKKTIANSTTRKNNFIKKRFPKSSAVTTEKQKLGRFGKSLELRRARTKARNAVGRNSRDNFAVDGPKAFNKNNLAQIKYRKNHLDRKIERRGYKFSAQEAAEAITELNLHGGLV